MKRTLPRTIVRRILTRAVLPCLILGGTMTVLPAHVTFDTQPEQITPAVPHAQPAPSLVRRLSKGHDCWRDNRHALPNAAIVNTGNGWHYTTNRTVVDSAFTLAIGGNPPINLRLYALCLSGATS